MSYHHAKKSLGQNFLVDPNYQRKIIQAVRQIYQGETILEIGPGQGALTQHLSEFAQKIILVEKDTGLAQELARKYDSQIFIKVINVDFLKWDLNALSDEKIIVVANLPYNVSTQILIKLLQNMNKFQYLFLMFQKEVAQRCVASPNSKDYGILSVWCQLLANVKKLFDVPPTAFRPRPKITSAVLHFQPSGIEFDKKQNQFMEFVKLIFSQRRKKIGTVLKAQQKYKNQILEDFSGKDLLEKRAENLSIEQLRQLFAVFKHQESY